MLKLGSVRRFTIPFAEVEHLIIVEDFHKAYDRTVAVAGISFKVAGGQILGLVGRNGAGKTTTLRTLAGIVTPSRGSLSVAGFDLDRQAVEAKQRLAYVPDDPQLFADLTVDQHLAFTASAYRVSHPEQKSIELLQQFELVGKRAALARDLSRGMRQKLAICCAYLHDPQAILLDEPLTGLDPHGIRTLKQSLLHRAEEGAAVIVSSHLLAMVEDICTHVFILERGEQRFFGPLSEVFATFALEGAQLSLEDVFFQAVGNSGHPAATPL